MAKDPHIRERMNRTKEIIERLDTDECSLEEGTELYEDGQQLLAEIREQLHEGEGAVFNIE
jgi:exodeoxyribonuclease VII small subunit